MQRVRADRRLRRLANLRFAHPVRSSHSHFVKVSGLRWLSMMLLVEIPWAKKVWGLPFLTVLAPSERYHKQQQHRHKKLTDWARQIILQTKRWLPERSLVIVAQRVCAERR